MTPFSLSPSTEKIVTGSFFAVASEAMDLEISVDDGNLWVLLHSFAESGIKELLVPARSKIRRTGSTGTCQLTFALDSRYSTSSHPQGET